MSSSPLMAPALDHSLMADDLPPEKLKLMNVQCPRNVCCMGDEVLDRAGGSVLLWILKKNGGPAGRGFIGPPGDAGGRESCRSIRDHTHLLASTPPIQEPSETGFGQV